MKPYTRQISSMFHHQINEDYSAQMHSFMKKIYLHGLDSAIRQELRDLHDLAHGSSVVSERYK